MVNILYTINFLTNGGPTRVLQNIVNGLDKKKYNITILTLIDQNDCKIVESLRKSGIQIIELNYKKRLSQIIKEKSKIIKIINDTNPDIIHTHGIVTTFIVSDKKVNGCKLTTIHNNMYEDYSYTYGKIKGKIFAYFHINCLKKFDETICCSKTSYDILKSKLKRISYIRNGIDVNKSSNNIRNGIRKELNIDNSSIIYIYGGVLTNRKRIVELVKMFAKTLKKNEYLLIVGDGPLRQEAERYSNENIKFLGFKTNIIEYFMASDIYTSYSSSEGFSISVIEALSCGLFCFLSDIPSHKECFEIDRNYYIGEHFNKNNFCYKKEALLNKIKKENKNKLSEFQNKYLSLNSMVEKYEDIYNRRCTK